MLTRFILFVLFFYLVYYLFRNLFLRPFKQGYGEGGKGGANPFKREKEGDVTISYNPNQKAHDKDGVGEYVDYEEVKDKD